MRGVSDKDRDVRLGLIKGRIYRPRMFVTPANQSLWRLLKPDVEWVLTEITSLISENRKLRHTIQQLEEEKEKAGR
jgi:hypothetical protein